MATQEENNRLNKIAEYQEAIKSSKNKKDIATFITAIATHKVILGLDLNEEELDAYNKECDSFDGY